MVMHLVWDEIDSNKIKIKSLENQVNGLEKKLNQLLQLEIKKDKKAKAEAKKASDGKYEPRWKGMEL